MHPNIGTVDRVLRIVGGILLIAAAALGKIGWWGYIGIIPLVTGLVRFCPAYTLLGFRTCSATSAKQTNA